MLCNVSNHTLTGYSHQPQYHMVVTILSRVVSWAWGTTAGRKFVINKEIPRIEKQSYTFTCITFEFYVLTLRISVKLYNCKIKFFTRLFGKN